MTDTSSSSQSRPARSAGDSGFAHRAALARAIPRRPAVSWWLGLVLAVGFAAVVTPAITAERWLLRFQPGSVVAARDAPFTVRAPMLTGYDDLRIRGGVVVARGEAATRDEATLADAIAAAMPRGPVLYLAVFALTFALGALFTHHVRRSTKGRLVRVQVVSLAAIAALAIAVKAAMAASALSALVVPVAVLAIVPTLALDRIVGLATGVLGALVVSLLAPFDVGLAILLLVQAATAGLVVSERARRRWSAALGAGLAATLCTAATYLLLTYLMTGHAPDTRDPLHSPWLASAIGPAIAAVIAVPLLPLYQLLVGEITQGKLFALEDLGHPLLRQIAERSPGTWQHSLMMANMAEIAANAIGASGRLVRVGAYFHDLGKSLQPKYFIENLEPGETSPHDRLPPEVSCDAIFAHVTDGIVTARKAGLHERVVDFMHMHHGNGVLEYFWGKCREQGNPNHYTIEAFRYPGHPPQSRETAILAICDAVEAASRTLKKPDPAAIDSLVQRIVYGKLHLGQLDESGLSMSDLRRISDSLRETIRHANHGRIEYPWQRAGQDASASVMTFLSNTPRLDSLDRRPGRDSAAPPVPAPADSDAALAITADAKSPGEPSRALAAGSGAPIAAQVRAGTARNAQPDLAAAAPAPEPSRSASEAGAFVAQREGNGVERRPPTQRDAEPPPAATTATSRELTTTVPGRAPGPLPPPPDIISPATFDDAAPARKRAATLPPVQPRRPPTPAPPIATRRAPTDAGHIVGAPTLAAAPRRAPTSGEDAREAGPPAPVDLDNANANPPPPRRGPSGHPPVPSDPAQLAAALASTVFRVGAPFSMPSEPAEPSDAARTSRPTTGQHDRAPTGAPAPARSSALSEDGRRTRPPNTLPGYAEPDENAGTKRRASTVEGQAETRPPAPPRSIDDRVTAPRSATAPQATPTSRASIDDRVTAPRSATAPQVTPAASASIDERITWPRILTAEAPAASGSPVSVDERITAPRSATASADSPTSIDDRITAPRSATASPDSPASIDERITAPRMAAASAALSIDEWVTSAPSPDQSITIPRANDARAAAQRRVVAAAEADAGVTEPSLPVLAGGDEARVDLDASAVPEVTEAKTDWSSGLAARIDAVLDSDEWGKETPIIPPTKAELRALLGQPDPTRQQPIDEIEMLQRRAAELADEHGAPDARRDGARRRPHPTAEVDPDDIEAAIELAPPARRATTANAIGVAKLRPKKPPE